MPTDFSALGVRPDLVASLDALGIREPYPIQSATLPATLAGRDLFAQSPTGSGKTLAFALPLVTRVGKAEHGRPRALVLAPTRELAAQITDVIQPLAKIAGRRVACFYGGTGYREQLTALRRGVDIAVGCPGRLIDLLERGALDLSAVDVVVVDEADRMADMGFLPPVRRLLRTIEGPRQTMLFSATVSRDVERIVEEFQQQPARHLLESASDDVGSRSHEFWRVAHEERAAITARLVATLDSSIVFCRTKHGADRLARQLGREGITVVAIHGDRSQSQRERALAQFRGRHAQVLVGTDVAARGLHVDGVDCVVHFDPPGDDDTYVHRSGRTGRAGASGRVVSLVTPDHERAARALERRFAGDVEQGPEPEQQSRRQGRPRSPYTARRRIEANPSSSAAARVTAPRGTEDARGAGSPRRPRRGVQQRSAESRVSTPSSQQRNRRGAPARGASKGSPARG